jgi:hypothetical protein
MSAKTPVEDLVNKIWSWLGERWGARLAVLLVAVTTLGWFISTWGMFEKLWPPSGPPGVYASSDEIACLNEWVLRLAATDSQSQAAEAKTSFLADYKDFGHENNRGEPIWKNDVHVVRDAEQKNKWLVVIDMYPGASSKQCMEEGKNEMISVLEAKPKGDQREWNNRIGRLLRPAEPLCYDFNKFEKVNGKILNTSNDIEDQRALGPCADKLRRAPNKKCWQ